MSYYIRKSWKYAKSFWPWRSSSTAAPESVVVDDSDFVVVPRETEKPEDSAPLQNTWSRFVVEQPEEPFSLDKTYELMSKLCFQKELNEDNYHHQVKNMKKLFHYFCQHKETVMENFFGIYMTFQDLLISCALFSKISLREEFEYLYGYNLDDICSGDAIILPFDPPPNYCKDKTEYLEAVEKIIKLIQEIDDQTSKEVIYIQFFNYVCNNLDMTRQCPLLQKSIMYRLDKFEKETNFQLNHIRQILQKLQ